MTDLKGERPDAAETAIEPQDEQVGTPLNSSLTREVRPIARLAPSPHATPKRWRDILPVHPAAELFPLMSPEELRELADDIVKNGLHEPVSIMRDGDDMVLLDGRNRLDAVELLGLDMFPMKKKGGVEEIHWENSFIGANNEYLGFSVFEIETEHYVNDPFAFVIGKNIRRRHLTTEQKRDLLAALLKADPEKSNRQIAAITGHDDKTVAGVRKKLEATAEIPQLIKTKGKDGKARPARKKSGEGKPASEPKPTEPEAASAPPVTPPPAPAKPLGAEPEEVVIADSKNLLAALNAGQIVDLLEAPPKAKLNAVMHDLVKETKQLSIEQHFAALIELLVKEDRDALRKHISAFERDLNAAYETRGKPRSAKEQQIHDGLAAGARDMAGAINSLGK